MKSPGAFETFLLQRGSAGCGKYKGLAGDVHFLFPSSPFPPRWLLVASPSPSRAHHGEEAQSSSGDRESRGRGGRGRAGQGRKRVEEVAAWKGDR